MSDKDSKRMVYVLIRRDYDRVVAVYELKSAALAAAQKAEYLDVEECEYIEQPAGSHAFMWPKE